MSIEKLVQFVLLLFWINNSNLINRWLYRKMCKLYNEISQSVTCGQMRFHLCKYTICVCLKSVELISDDLFGLLISKFVPCWFSLIHSNLVTVSFWHLENFECTRSIERERFKHQSLIWFVGGVNIFLCTHFIRMLIQLSRKCKRSKFFL